MPESQQIHYIQMNGLGNKFVIIKKSDLDSEINLKDLAISMSESSEVSHYDQMILYEEYSEYVEMFVYNNDGSKAGMCGNASRCLMKLMHDENGHKGMKLKVGDRFLDCKYSCDEKIIVNMGVANFKPDWMPPHLEKVKEFIYSKIDVDHITVADVGNPHIIILLRKEVSRELMEEIGCMLQTDAFFPAGINVNFAHITEGEINLIVYERGAGFTEACASGATATFASLYEGDFIGDSSIVHFSGGDLSMSKSANGFVMCGNAQKTGEADFHQLLSFEELAS